ncbi:MAG: DAK2 domain-containing protein, partial [Clostridia bacterium]|nr:DAK2 domain-containing protein [Clostridia bacterium]
MLITHLTGPEYADMVRSGAHALQRRRDEIDHLNVYPVPDGDTGSNMSMTVSPIDDLICPDPSLEAVSARIASQFLRSARGNSGVILSLFFRGVSRGFKGLREADAGEVQAAFQCGVEEAYKAVQDPKEGTILTVMRVSASVPHGGDDLTEFFRLMLESAGKTL